MTYNILQRAGIKITSAVKKPAEFFRYLLFRRAWLQNTDAKKRTAWLDKRRQISPLRGVRYMFQKDFKKHMLNMPMSGAHPHAEAARLRTSTSVAFGDWISTTGYKRYEISMSRREQSCVAVDGQRYIYSARDCALDFRSDPIGKNHILCLTDVDYYVNSTDWAEKYLVGQPVLMYTFVPERLGGDTPNATYSIISSDTVQYTVDGGGRYEHQLWDWDTDMLISYSTKRGKCFVYAVDQFLVAGDNTRRVVFLSPLASFYDPYLIAFDFLKSTSKTLQRRVFGPVGGKFGITAYRRDERDFVCIGEYGGATCEILLTHFNHAYLRFEVAETKNMGSIERYYTAAGAPNAPEAAIVSYAYFSANASKSYGIMGSSVATIPILPMPSLAVPQPVNYQTTLPLVTEEGRATGRVILPPVIEGLALVPAQSYNNDTACIQGRLTAVRNTVVPGREYKTYAAEWKDMLCPIGKGAPVTLEEVVEAQLKPSQKARNKLVLSDWVRAKCSVKAFQKKEVYHKITDPRNISGVPTEHTLALGSYDRGFRIDLKKRAKWFACGETPAELSEKVQQVARSSETIAITDYSRFDGTNSVWLRENIELAALLQWVSPRYREEVTNLLRDEIHAKGRTTHGVRYELLGSRPSGGPTTTTGNTLINHFVIYCARRRVGMSKSEAMNRPGLYYGDDGITSGDTVLFATMDSVAKDLGLKLKSEVVSTGRPVPFVGRVFLDPWSTSSSIQDPKRTLAKLHVTNDVEGIPLTQTIANKMRGYLVTDAQTPVIGDYCRAVLRLEDIKDVQYKEGLDRDLDWRFRNGPYPFEMGDSDLAVDIIAHSLGVTTGAVERYVERLSEVKKIDEFPPPLLKAEPECTLTAVLGGEVYYPGGCNLINNANNESTTAAATTTNTQPTPQPTTTRSAPSRGTPRAAAATAAATDTASQASSASSNAALEPDRGPGPCPLPATAATASAGAAGSCVRAGSGEQPGTPSVSQPSSCTGNGSTAVPAATAGSVPASQRAVTANPVVPRAGVARGGVPLLAGGNREGGGGRNSPNRSARRRKRGGKSGTAPAARAANSSNNKRPAVTGVPLVGAGSNQLAPTAAARS